MGVSTLRVGVLRFRLACLAWLLLWGIGCSARVTPPASTTSSAATEALVGVAVEPTAELPLATELAAPTPDPRSRLLPESYPGVLVEGQVPLFVYLPPGYSQLDSPPPTLYLLHGLGYDEWQWLRLGVARLATEAILNGDWPAFVMVMPLQPEPLFINSDGGPGSYEEEFMQGVVAYVEGRYELGLRRGLAGISRGGVWALEIALRNPSYFQAVAALSPALDVNFARPQYDPLGLAAVSPTYPGDILLAVGDREPAVRRSTQALADSLAAAQADYQLMIASGGHDDQLWRQLVTQTLDFLADALFESQS